MSTVLCNKTISKRTPLHKENPFPQFSVAGYKHPGIRLSFEYTTSLLSGEGGEGKNRYSCDTWIWFVFMLFTDIPINLPAELNQF